MRRILLTVAYDGTDYCGWQIQPNGRAVQEVLETALAELLGSPAHVIGASRTDAGVHARGNLAVFDTEARMAADRFAFALNTYLPPDVRIQASEEVDPSFHPQRIDAIKTYEYKILNRTMPDPLIRRDTLHWYGKLDVPAMQEAARKFIGTHDFRSFAAAGGATEKAEHSRYETPEKHGTVRTIYASELISTDLGASREAAPEAGDSGQGMLLTYRVTGNGFLYNMVRIMAGTILEVGRGERRPEEIPAILAACDRTQAGATAPAHALTLCGIRIREHSAKVAKNAPIPPAKS